MVPSPDDASAVHVQWGGHSTVVAGPSLSPGKEGFRVFAGCQFPLTGRREFFRAKENPAPEGGRGHLRQHCGARRRRSADHISGERACARRRDAWREPACARRATRRALDDPTRALASHRTRVTTGRLASGRLRAAGFRTDFLASTCGQPPCGRAPCERRLAGDFLAAGLRAADFLATALGLLRGFFARPASSQPSSPNAFSPRRLFGGAFFGASRFCNSICLPSLHKTTPQPSAR